MLKEFDIPRSLLPEVKPTSGVLGETVADLLGAEIPVAAVAGDQQAALFGQACFEPGMAKNTFGTAGCFDMNAGGKVRLVEGMATNVAWQLADKVEYTVAGVALVSGAVVQWLRDEMQMVTSAGETAKLAAEVDDTTGARRRTRSCASSSPTSSASR